MWKIGLTFLCTILFLQQIKAQGNCEIPEVTDWAVGYTNEAIFDIRSGLIKNFTDLVNVVGIVGVTGVDSIYWDVEYNAGQNTVDISTSSQFSSFEDNLIATSPHTMSIDIELQCETGTRTLTYKQPVKDTNNHECVFNNYTYTYVVPNPLPPTVLSDIFPVYATDLDYSNVMLYFLIIEPVDYLTIVWDGFFEDNPKKYKATMRTTAELQLNDTLTLTMTVTDFNWVEVAYLHLVPEDLAPKSPA